jgi:hypothetical protein
MTATLTISLGDDILKALREAKAITIALDSGGRAARGGAGASRAARPAKGEAGAFRAGSLPAKLVAWAGGRKRPFGVQDLMTRFRIKRGHASMLVAYVLKAGAVRRVGRGEYSAA